MSTHSQEYPYKPLGSRLRRLREQLSETLAEVSGAVEIDIEALNLIERGEERPTEDILMLLISHFAAKDEEAERLWQLAGYQRERLSTNEVEGFLPDDADATKSIVMVLPMEARIAYTDMAHVIVNDFGVVVNFMQTLGPNNKPLAISRLGMSREHARSVVDLLQKALQQSEPKALPSPRQEHDTEQADKPK